jgi:transcriptional regulator with XRE-family HTH domain
VKKSLYSREQVVLQNLLRQLRHEAGLLQGEVAARLDTYQTFVSKYESGERILDFPELRSVCGVLGLSLPEFAVMYEKALEQTPE